MSRITGNDALGLMEAYNSIYSPESQEEEVSLEQEIFENIAYALLAQGHTVEDVIEYFENITEEELVEDYLSVIDEKFIIESVVSQEYIEEQFEILYERNVVKGLVNVLKGAGNLLRGAGSAAMKGLGAAGKGAANLAQRAGTKLKNTLFPTVRQARAAAAAKAPKPSATRPAPGTSTRGGSWNYNPQKGPAPSTGTTPRVGSGGQIPSWAGNKPSPAGTPAGRARQSLGVGAASAPRSNAARNALIGGAALGAGTGAYLVTRNREQQASTPAAPRPQASTPTPSRPPAAAPSAPSAPAPSTPPAAAPSAPAPTPEPRLTPRSDTATPSTTPDSSASTAWRRKAPPLWGQQTQISPDTLSGKDGALWGTGTTARFDSTRSTGAKMAPLGQDPRDSIFSRGTDKTPDEARAEFEKKMKGQLNQSTEKKIGNIAASYEYTDAYDVIMEYLISSGQADTLDEANYIMLEMDEEAIGTVLEYYGLTYGEIEEEYELTEEYEEYEEFLDEAMCFLLDEGLSFEDISYLNEEYFSEIFSLEEGLGSLLGKAVKKLADTARQGRLFKRSGQPYNFQRKGVPFISTDPVASRRSGFTGKVSRPGVTSGSGVKKRPQSSPGQLSIDFSAKPQAPAKPQAQPQAPSKPQRNTIPDFIKSINDRPMVNAPVKSAQGTGKTPSKSLPSVRKPSPAERQVDIGGGRKRGTVSQNRFSQPDSTDFQKKAAQSKTLGDLAKSYGADIDWKKSKEYGKPSKPELPKSDFVDRLEKFVNIDKANKAAATSPSSAPHTPETRQQRLNRLSQSMGSTKAERKATRERRREERARANTPAGIAKQRLLDLGVGASRRAKGE